MAESLLSLKYLQDEQAAYDFIESKIWPNGTVCRHCGGCERNKRMEGSATRIGLYKCYDCRKQFTVKIGTIFESSHIKMHLWLQAIFLIAGSKKGISSNQLHRTLGITLKSAWFMSRRIREAMKDASDSILGGCGSIVEADEAFMVAKKGFKKAHAGHYRTKVFPFVSHEGKNRSFHVANIDSGNLKPIMTKHIAKDAHLMTDMTLTAPLTSYLA